MKKFRRTTLSASILASLFLAQAAYAQSVAPATGADAAQDAANTTNRKATDPQELSEIVVTGIRESLKRSLDNKRQADSHVDVVTAEDIGKMPDKNVADSLMRVAGVTTSSASANEGGFDENDRVSMRGTNPSLTQTLINGHSVSSGDWFVLNQTGTVGRSVTYTLLPSEIVNKVVVHKTAEASDVEGGVAGYVDIQTRKPLEFTNPFTAMVTAGGVYAERPDKTDPQFSGLINWKNDDKTFGMMLQLFDENRHLRRDGQELLGYSQIAPGSTIATAHPDLANVWYPNLLGSALFEQKRERRGGLLEFEWAPADNLSFDLSGFSSKLNASNYNRNYMFWGARVLNGGTITDNAGQAPDPGYVVRNGTLVSAHFTADPTRQYGIYDEISRPDESSNSRYINLDVTWRATESLSFKAQLGDTKGDGKTPTQNVAEWDTGVGTGAAYNLHGVDTAASWNLGSETTNTGPHSLDWIFGDQNIDVRDQEKWGKLDGAFAIGSGALTDLKFGGRYADHTRKSEGVIGQGPMCGDHSAFSWGSPYFCSDASVSPFNPANWPQGLSFYPSDFGSDLGSGFPTNIWMFTPAQLAAFDAKYTNRDPVSRADWTGDYSLKEKDSALYVQADFDGQGWSGNIGVRFVRTEENIVANLGVGGATPGAITTSAFGPYLPTQFNNTYNDILPSGNLKFDLQEDLILRLAASKTMTRPDYSALAGPISLSNQPAAPGGTGSGNGSNPNLKPVRSNNFDASLEWYFAPRSILSASVFYMDLTSYVGIGHVTQTYKTFNSAYPEGFDAPYVLSVPINSSGSVKGFELAYEQPIWENFGIAANYTYADGSEKGGGPLVGTSKNTYNIGGYYEDEHFNARLSYTYRSSFFSGLDRLTAFSQDSVGTLSASLGYKLNDMWSFSLDGLNLNNPKLKYYALNKDQPRSMYENGAQYYFAVHFKF